MYKIFIILVTGLILSACATTANYQRQLTQWQGKNIQAVTLAWGEPNVQIRLKNNHHVYLYSHQQVYTQPFHVTSPGALVNMDGKTTYMTSYNEFYSPGKISTRYCNTWFETDENNIVIGTRFQGNNCVAGGP